MSRLLPDNAPRPRVLAVDREQLVWFDASEGSTMTDWSLIDAPGNALSDALGRTKPGLVDLIAGNDLALHWVQTPPASVESLAELHLVAQSRCNRLFGPVTGGWRIAADWSADRPFVCAALPCEVITLVETQLAACGLVARWHSAWSMLTCAMPQVFPHTGWSAVRTLARVMLWHCSGGEVDVLASLPVALHEDSGRAARRALQQIQVESSRADFAPAGDLHWLDLVSGLDVASIGGLVNLQPAPRIAPAGSAPATEASTVLRLHALMERGVR